MKFLTIDYIKKHSRIVCDCEDVILKLYGDSAEQTIANYLNRGKRVSDMVDSLIQEYGEIPADIYHAGLMLVDLSYQRRGAADPQVLSAIPYGNIDLKLKNYMVL